MATIETPRPSTIQIITTEPNITLIDKLPNPLEGIVDITKVQPIQPDIQAARGGRFNGEKGTIFNSKRPKMESSGSNPPPKNDPDPDYELQPGDEKWLKDVSPHEKNLDPDAEKTKSNTDNGSSGTSGTSTSS